jgi:hypothetical protein
MNLTDDADNLAVWQGAHPERPPLYRARTVPPRIIWLSSQSFDRLLAAEMPAKRSRVSVAGLLLLGITLAAAVALIVGVVS